MSNPSPVRIPPLADRFFEASLKFGTLEEEVEDALEKACGIVETNADGKIFDDITFDWYDTSFEFKRIHGDWTPTVAQLAACWALGFSRCWLCYDDGTERYCNPQIGIGERRKKGA